jgi:hypothetical protein
MEPGRLGVFMPREEEPEVEPYEEAATRNQKNKMRTKRSQENYRNQPRRGFIQRSI